MTQIILNIEDKSILPSLRKILSKIEGVSICKQKVRKGGLEKALEDVKTGHVSEYSSVDVFFKTMGE